MIREQSTEPKSRSQLLMDLDVIRNADCSYIVKYHGCDFVEGALWVIMELQAIDWHNLCYVVADMVVSLVHLADVYF